MKKTVFTSLICSLFCSTLTAYPSTLSLPWLSPMLGDNIPGWSVDVLNKNQDLFDCGEKEEGKEFCSEVVNYYTTPVQGHLWLAKGSVNKIQLNALFTANNYSKLQLNIRKDGYVLAWVEIAGKHIDIIDQLKNKPFHIVDREVIMFMNSGRISSPRRLLWYPETQYQQANPSRYVEFVSDGVTINVNFFKL
ncbi:hypothetical protein [Psychromonas sp. SR45-3]|uniref:hypothetical protein n=1 Tax=Psychromonas sp. SR45-3 TaxID=2760930 RepID=UPI0015FE577E|nr:hypothetical protein [Psychromonas sp. SR45-3]MBB1272140.1 hypothetical protein [Psychromonas sp. SR45-3]